MSEELEPLAPQEALDMYVEHRGPELAEKSLQNQKYRLDTFVEFCEEYEIENLNELTGRDCHRYRTWRSRQDIAPMTLRTHLATLRVFLEFCASIDAVEEGLREKVVLPEITKEDQARDVKLSEDRAEAILEHLERFDYASRDHVVIAVLWHTGIRLGTLRALDVDDWDPSAPCFEIRHRPESETPLKNGKAAERSIAVGNHYARIIEDYLEYNRIAVTDDYGREPFISSKFGRLSPAPIRKTVYEWTRPCLHSECPHEREPDTCEAMQTPRVSACPSGRSPHGIRRGALTRMLREGTPEGVVSDRSNVSSDVLDTHYDRRTERERMDIRREFIEDA